ncbi:LAMI_0C10946g1_1 [Lachancea mirantina]|uniref:LAMI_0C10946g1_1 n=1 Tax=Lachancea mirantina TaxID=1230905 RepID=A0A1G4J692_9SACH|nr:LAMI_0C10946g1_1 [Lachancea mirantina]
MSLTAIGGFPKGTKIVLSNGESRAVEDIKVGDEVMNVDGEGSQVTEIRTGFGSLVKIKQLTKHTAHLRDQSRSEPWGTFEFVCSSHQQILVQTLQRVKHCYKKNRTTSVVEHRVLDKIRTNDGRTVVRIKTASKTFQHVKFTAAMIESYKQKISLDPIQWQCQVDDLTNLTPVVRTATKMLRFGFSFEKPYLQVHLEQIFERKISLREVEAMAWMLGFWIGDGHRRGALFALHSGDHDVNQRLEENAATWGMSLRIVPRDGFKANGYLHTHDENGIRHWNRHNPFTLTLKSLDFLLKGRIDAPKNVPIFMRTDTFLVREAFMAGLIDSDGCTSIADNIVRAKISTVYVPIRDGILFIGQSLGLNVTTTFSPMQDSRRGIHENDIWTFNLFPGQNGATLMSILKRCACERKRNPRSINQSRKRGPDSDELEIEDDEDEEDLRKRVTADDTEVDVLSPEESADSDDELLDDLEAEPQHEVMVPIRRSNRLNLSLMPFQVSDHGSGEIIELVLDSESNASLVTDSHLIFGGETKPQVLTIPNNTRKCASCNSTETLQWYKMSWNTKSPKRLCQCCYKAYEHSKHRCSNDRCNRVFKPSDINTKDRREQKKRLPFGKEFVVAHSCEGCGSAIVSDAGGKISPPALSANDARRRDTCYCCGPTESTYWRKAPWDRSKPWCSRCRGRYDNSKTFCTGCHNIPDMKEVREMEANREFGGPLKCLKCGSVAEREATGGRPSKKNSCIDGLCTCGARQSFRWNALPWDKTSNASLCGACYKNYNVNNTRCLSCQRVIKKSKWDEVTSKPKKEYTLQSGARVVTYSCPFCQGPTEGF